MGVAETITGDSLTIGVSGIEGTVKRFLDSVDYGGGSYRFKIDMDANVDVTYIVNDGDPQTANTDGTETEISTDNDNDEIQIDFNFNEETDINFEVFRYTGNGDCLFPLNEQFSDAEDGYDGNWEIVENGTTLTPSGNQLSASGDGVAYMTCNNLSVESTQVILNSIIAGETGDVASVVINGPSGGSVTFYFLPDAEQVFDDTNIDASELSGTDIRLQDYNTQLNGGIVGIEVVLEGTASLTTTELSLNYTYGPTAAYGSFYGYDLYTYYFYVTSVYDKLIKEIRVYTTASSTENPCKIVTLGSSYYWYIYNTVTLDGGQVLSQKSVDVAHSMELEADENFSVTIYWPSSGNISISEVKVEVDYYE